MREAIIIVCGGLLQVPAVDCAREMGLLTIVTDGNPGAPAMSIADQAVELDIYDVDGHRRLARSLQSRYQVRGVFTEGADVEVTVAAIAEELGLPGITVEAAKNTKDKVRARLALERAGVSELKWCAVEPRLDPERAAEKVGYPLVVKPRDNSASRGTSIVERPDQLDDAVLRARSASSDEGVLLEQRLYGDEQSVEILFDGSGPPKRLNIVDRLFSYDEGNAIEVGHVNPTSLQMDRQKDLFELTERAASAVGVSFGAFKADTILTDVGPKILEVTARLSGGFDCQYTTPLASGRNFIRAAMRLALGMPLDDADLNPRWRRCAVALAGFPPPGRVTGINGVDEASSVEGVEQVFLRVAEGDVIPDYRDCAVRPYFVVASGPTREAALESARQGVARVSIATSG